MSCPEPTDKLDQPASLASKSCTILQWASLAAAITLGVTLGWRTITGADIGCHLTYGEHLLDTGEIIDSNMHIYTDVQPQGDYAMDYAPSSWIDDTGRLRFPNVNWASQLCMALAYRAGGPTGVCLLQAVLVAVLMTLISIAMLRTGVRPWAAAVGVAIVALTVQARFMHRTELFGFVIMAAQLCILIGPRIGKYSVIGILLLQAAFVQLHSSWMLGIFLTMCFCADRIARALWARYKKIDQPPDQGGQWKWFTGLVVAQMAMAFVSPWGWRTALLPVQMMWYLAANKLMPAGQAGVTHPWAVIKEMYPSLSPIFAWSVTSVAFRVALAVAAAAAITAIWAKRWSYLLLLTAMTVMGMQVRRNIGPSVVIFVPVAVAALWAAGAKLPKQWRKNRAAGNCLTAAASTATIFTCVWFFVSVVTNGFYYDQGIGPRFGPGISKVDIPIEAGEYLQTLPTDTKVFTTFGLSSNVLYFGRGETGYHDVPLLGNGWACPPRNMQLVRMIAKGKKPFGPFARRYGVGAVVLRVDKLSTLLANRLQLSPQWELRYLGARTAVFASTVVDPSPPLIIDGKAFIAKLEAMDSIPIYPLQAAARTLQHLEWYDLAIQVGERAVKVDSEYEGIWDVLGVSYAIRGKRRRSLRDPGFSNDFRQAKRCFTEAQKRDPDSQEIADKIRQVDHDLRNIPK